MDRIWTRRCTCCRMGEDNGSDANRRPRPQQVKAGSEINMYAGRFQTKDMTTQALDRRGHAAMRYHIELKGHNGPSEVEIDAYEYGNETRKLTPTRETSGTKK